MTLRFIDGFRPRGITPETALQEMDRLREEDEGLTPSRLFESARPKGSPLHQAFIWDGQKAVRELGLITARTMIRAIVHVPEADEPPAPPTRVFVHVPAARGEGYYQRMEIVAADVDMFAQAFTALSGKLTAAQEALNELRRVANRDPKPEHMAAFVTASEALQTARAALATVA